MNRSIFTGDYDCKVIRFWPTKNNPNVFQAVLQVDRSSYEAAMHVKHLFIGYESCDIYDAIEIRRCFKCSGYNHSAQNCNRKLSCPKCSLEHQLKDCKEDNFKCINCIKLNNDKDTDVDTNHAAWSNRCQAYIEASSKLRSDILSA